MPTTIKDLGFIHRFVPAPSAEAPVLLLLHGTGGNEDDLIPLAQQLLPQAALLSVCGKVLENGMPRFFRRFAEGVFDLVDLRFRTVELAEFIDKAREHYRLPERPIAVGYSNGANIAASLLLLFPASLRSAVLFRAMVPFEPDPQPDLSHVSILLSAGERDPIVPVSNTRSLAAIFERSGAEVTLSWHHGGHPLGQDDLEAARH